ncbi:acyltransferase [Mangrovimonas sp. TPBH4]|uniref:acyltransferase family protein n=1 Tax=Mangrovimonas sp. TPBH4 TaxID=1645914 RepID=UPI0006B436B5|nr:acyltransferase [Mangrovimonas sp. TPBH4]
MSVLEKHRVFGLDAIRALAILLVLVSHSTLLLYPVQENTFLTAIRFFGTVGVDLFFVLSGFLIGGIILKQINSNKVKFKDFVYFWMRRWFRTLPNYYFILTLNIFLVYIFSGEIINGVDAYFLFFQNFASAQQDFFTEAWSLSIEEFAYIIGPLFLYLSLLLVKRVSKHLLYLVITLLIIIGITICRYYFHMNNVLDSGQEWSRALRKVVVYRIDAIYYGFLAVYIATYFKDIWQNFRVHSFVVGMLLFFGMHAIFFYEALSPDNAPLFFNVFYLPFVAIALLLCFPFVIQIKSKGSLKRVITKLSVLSYAIYLTNYSIVLLTIQHFIDMSDSSMVLKFMVLLVYWSLSIYLSHLLYTYFEKPMMDLRDRPKLKALVK